MGEAPESLVREMVMQEREPGWLPTARTFGEVTLAGAGEERVYVMSTKDPSLRVYDPAFNLVAIHRLGREPRPVTQADIDRWVQWNLDTMGASAFEQATPDTRRFLEEHDYAETYPLFAGPWIVDDRGHVWIPEYDFPWSSTWTVFTPAGVYLGQVEMPDGFEAHHVRGDRVVGRWRDELDVEHVRVHRIIGRPPAG